MVPLEEMEHEDAESALQFIILLLAHVIDLLRDRLGVDFREPAGTQKLGLTARPGIKISLFRGGPLRFLTDRALEHRYVPYAPSAQSDIQRALRQFLAKAALIEFGDQGALKLVAFVEEGQAESKTDVLEDCGVLGPGDDGGRSHHCRE